MIANANQIVVPKSESNKRHLQSHPLQRSNSNGSKRSNQKKKKKKPIIKAYRSITRPKIARGRQKSQN